MKVMTGILTKRMNTAPPAMMTRGQERSRIPMKNTHQSQRGESAESGMVAVTMCCVGEQYLATEVAQSRANFLLRKHLKKLVIHLVTQKA